MERYLWAWRRLKFRVDEAPPKDGSDYELLDALITAVLKPAPKLNGDGRFSRLVNHLRAVRESAAIIKSGWRNEDEVLTAFLLGLEVAFESLDLTAKELEKGR